MSTLKGKKDIFKDYASKVKKEKKKQKALTVADAQLARNINKGAQSDAARKKAEYLKRLISKRSLHLSHRVPEACNSHT